MKPTEASVAATRSKPADGAARAASPPLGRILDSWQGAAVFYLLIAILVTLPGLGSTGLVMMEGMLASSAETMIETGRILVPELYGETYTYKPPLVYWLVALSIQAFGPTEWAVRFPGAVATVVLGFAVLVLVGRVTKPRVGLFAALAATTGVLWSQHAKKGEFDAVLGALVGVAIAAACYNFAVGRSRSPPWIWLLAYLALTAGFLAKGTPALMAFAPGLLAAAILSRQTSQLWSRGHLTAATLATVAVGAYLALVWAEAGAAAFEQPLAEAQRRGFEWTSASLGRTLAKPLIIIGAFLPWSASWPWGVVSPNEPIDSSLWRLRRSAAAFLGVGVLVFMAVPTHETRYYLPLSAAAAIVSALGLERLAESSRAATRFFNGLGLLVGGLAMALAFAPEFGPRGRILIAAVGFSTVAVLYGLSRLRPRYRVAYVLLATALCAWTVETWVLRPYRGRFRVLAQVAEILDTELPSDATIWALGEADIVGKNASLYHYLDRPVRTFHLGRPLPPTGSYVLLPARFLRKLEDASPGESARLRLIRRIHHPWRLFLLYQVEAP